MTCKLLTQANVFLCAGVFSPARRWSTPTTNVGVKLRQRQAQTPTRPLRKTNARDTKGKRNWQRHKSAQRQNMDLLNGTPKV